MINVFTEVLEFFIDFSKDEIDNDKLKLLELINQNFKKLIEEPKIFKSLIDQITTLALNACNLLVKSIFNISSSSNDDYSINIDHLMDIDIEQKKKS